MNTGGRLEGGEAYVNVVDECMCVIAMQCKVLCNDHF